MKKVLTAGLIGVAATGSLLAQATEAAPTTEQLVSQIAAAQSAGDNAWMMMSCALVLLMTGPGLALFYGGLVRKKNVLGTLMQSFIMMAVASVMWALVGYSLSFGDGNAYIGDMRFAMMNGVGMEPNGDYAGTIPHLTWMAFQMMFAIITPALITGAFAERMKFSALLLFTVLWSLLIYYPMAHMVWGKGGLLNAFSGGAIPTLDFAGGTVVHITSGVSALVCAIVIGKRLGYPNEPMRPHSLVLSFIGACLLWFGWFGFNAGSALSASGLAASAFVATHFGAAAAALGWILAEWFQHGKPSILGGISGCVAGLVAITPASGFVKPIPALIIGFAAGIVCYFAVVKVKNMLGYDDSLDAFGVHGVGGTLGAILTGVFATKEVNALKDATGNAINTGMVDGNSGQVVNQLIGVGISLVIAVVGSFLILKIVDVVVGLRVTSEQETMGLDLSMHGEEGYNLEA